MPMKKQTAPVTDSARKPVSAIKRAGSENRTSDGRHPGWHATEQERPNLTMINMVASVKFTGRIGVVGVVAPEDPNASDALEKKGQIAFEQRGHLQKAPRLQDEPRGRSFAPTRESKDRGPLPKACH